MRKITVVAIVTAAVCLVALVLFLGRTTVGLQMRAAAMDFQTARLLGVRANRVIGSAVLVSGILAAIVAVMLTVQQPLVTSTFALRETIVVLAGVVVGGMNRLLSATLGGFAIGYASGLLGGALPTDQSQYLPSFLFGLVILTLLVRPGGALHARPRAGGAGMRRLRTVAPVLAPLALVAATALVGSFFERSTEIYFINALVAVSIVVALYVFVGNSGVLSFGHISLRRRRRLDGGRALRPGRGEARDDADPLRLPRRHDGRQRPVAPARRARRRGVRPSRGAAADAALRGSPRASRPSRCSRSRTTSSATTRGSGPGLNVFSSVPETTDMQQAAIGAIVVIVVAFAYQVSRFGRQLRAARDDAPAARAVGISVYRQRLVAFALSGALAGFAGGLYVHYLPINVDAVYLDLTFITLAMLVIGGMTSLWGAVVGALAVSGLDSLLAEAENGAVGIDLPSGSRIVVVGALMALVLILRPSGITGGKEVRLAASRASSPRRKEAT